MSGKSAGQLAYEARRRSFWTRHGIKDDNPLLEGESSELIQSEWDQLTDAQRADEEAAATAVETDQLRLAREDRDQLRKRVLDLAAALEAEGAEEIAIGRKRQGPADEIDKNRGRVFKLCASRIRRLAGPPS